jgi:hypothetical protein
MNLNKTGILFMTILLLMITLLPVVAGAESNTSNGTAEPVILNLTATPAVTDLVLSNETVNETEFSPTNNYTEDNATGINGTASGNVTDSVNLRQMANTVSEPMVYTTLSPGDAPPEAKNYDHYVSFHMRANSLAQNYAYDMISRGEPGDGTQWVYTIYLLGSTSDWGAGEVGVIGHCTVGSVGLNWVSPRSTVLSPGTDYYVVWRYNKEGGGELFINNISQGAAVAGDIDNNLSTAFHVGEDMYVGGGRQHSAFDGTIWDVYHYEKDLEPVVFTFSMSCIENYDYKGHLDGVFNECDNVALRLNETPGWKMTFYHKDAEVTPFDFGTSDNNHPSLVDSTFYYHSGHGVDLLHLQGSLGTIIMLKNYNEMLIPPFYQGGIVAQDVNQKWGGKNKWVMLQSCNILVDRRWDNALTTSHGILGYSTTTGENSELPNIFFDYAINKKEPVVLAYQYATQDVFNDPNIMGAVIVKTSDQFNNEQFPGIGYSAPDSDPSVKPIYWPWPCVKKEGTST